MLIKLERPLGTCEDCSEAATFAIIAQGATGRWCDVLGFCEAHIDTTTAIPASEARRKIDEAQDGYADF
jgi:hypothetical protein